MPGPLAWQLRKLEYFLFFKLLILLHSTELIFEEDSQITYFYLILHGKEIVF